MATHQTGLFGFTRAILNQYPSGRWGFVGKVPAKLAYLGTEDEINRAVRAGCPQFLKTRAFATADDAKAAYAEVVGEPYPED